MRVAIGYRSDSECPEINTAPLSAARHAARLSPPAPSLQAPMGAKLWQPAALKGVIQWSLR